MHNMSRSSFYMKNLISSNFVIRLCALMCLIEIWSQRILVLIDPLFSHSEEMWFSFCGAIACMKSEGAKNYIINNTS